MVQNKNNYASEIYSYVNGLYYTIYQIEITHFEKMLFSLMYLKIDYFLILGSMSDGLQ